jgi:hypothetical protein
VLRDVTTLIGLAGRMRQEVAGAITSPSAKPPSNETRTLADVAAAAHKTAPDGASAKPSRSYRRRRWKARRSSFDQATTVWDWVGHHFDDGICKLAEVTNTRPAHLIDLMTAEGRHEAEEGKGNASQRYWLEVVLLVAVLASVGVFYVAQQREQLQAFAGRLSVASRSFIGPTALAFTVADFGTEAQAQEGMQALADRLEAKPLKPGELDLSQLEEIRAPALREGVRAYRGQVLLGDVTADVGFLMVHDGRYVHIMQSLSANGAPTAPVELAGRLFGPGPYLGLAAAPAATPSVENRYRTGGLWDRLPLPEQLPPGYRVAAETEGFDPTLFGSAG